MQPVGRPGPDDSTCPNRPDAINQVGATHLGFEVEDTDAFRAALPDDVEPLSGPQEVDIGVEILFFRDPDGNFVEVLEG